MSDASGPSIVPPERVRAELDRFHRFRERARLGAVAVEPIDPHGFVLRGRRVPHDRPYDLVVTALVHGNETGGLVAINALLEAIASERLSPKLNLAFVLANVEAARRGRRYVERDMNRSFAFADESALEVRRVRAIEPIIGASRYSFDFHQTIEPTRTPFFVIRYSQRSACFAAMIAAHFPAIVEHDGRFSTTGGMTSHEFAHSQGCTAVSLEIGRIGVDPEGVGVGVEAVMRAISTVEAARSEPAVSSSAMRHQDLFSWMHVELYPDEHITLVPALGNFDFIAKGRVLGHGENGRALTSPVDGILIFPKYVSRGDPTPPEIYRLLGRFTVDERGIGSVHPPEPPV